MIPGIMKSNDHRMVRIIITKPAKNIVPKRLENPSNNISNVTFSPRESLSMTSAYPYLKIGAITKGIRNNCDGTICVNSVAIKNSNVISAAKIHFPDNEFFASNFSDDIVLRAPVAPGGSNNPITGKQKVFEHHRKKNQ